MQRVIKLYLLFMFYLCSFFNMQAASVVSQAKAGHSIVTRTVRPILRVIHGVTEDLRWLLCLFAIGEFFIYKSSYDIYQAPWLKLCVAAFVAHYASKAILDEMPN